MKQEEFFEVLADLDDAYIAEANEPVKRAKKKQSHRLLKWGAIAACLCLVVGGFYQYMRGGKKLELSEQSKGVTVRYAAYVPDVASEACLMYLTEEELFTEYSSVIFKGTVTQIDNIRLDFNGYDDYRALAEIQIEKVYHGKCVEGESVWVLLPGAVSEGSHNSIMDTLGQLEVGMTGIFMPKAYTKDSIYQMNGATLYLKDLAEYGFGDGIRFAFLETEDGLVFDRSAYEGAKDAFDLEDIEAYIYEMLELYFGGNSRE